MDYKFKLTLIGGPQEKVDEIVKEFDDTNIEFFYKYKIPKNKVPEYMNTLDIGIVPYPNEFHMANYASPLKYLNMLLVTQRYYHLILKVI